MKRENLNMILKLREWDEELEKQKFSKILAERNRAELYLYELERRFELLSKKITDETDSDQLINLFSEIEYLQSLIKEAKELVEKLNQEVEIQRAVYEETHKEKRKVEQLYDRFVLNQRREREKLEEKVVNDLFTTRYGRQQ